MIATRTASVSDPSPLSTAPTNWPDLCPVAAHISSSASQNAGSMRMEMRPTCFDTSFMQTMVCGFVLTGKRNRTMVLALSEHPPKLPHGFGHGVFRRGALCWTSFSAICLAVR